MPVGGIEPWCRRPHGTPTTPFRLLGEPLHRFSRPPSQASARSPRDDLAGVSWNASGPTCTRNFEDPMRHRILRTFGQVRRFRCVHISCHRLIPTLPTVTAYLPRYHRHRSTRSDPAVRRSEHPSFNPLAIAARSCIINIRRTNNPLPDKHCCYDPMTPPGNYVR